ncbi:hypothetical protein [Streptomyces sp. NPDC002889]|uniref:hypothetical protein n=1 Tax=Streptomyces sp. NPDC002889 TaxID=3364669 RepID=UPI0036AB1A68
MCERIWRPVPRAVPPPRTPLPHVRESITVDGHSVKIGPWFAKVRTKRRVVQLSTDHECLAAALFDGDWTEGNTVPPSPALPPA